MIQSSISFNTKVLFYNIFFKETFIVSIKCKKIQKDFIHSYNHESRLSCSINLKLRFNFSQVTAF